MIVLYCLNETSFSDRELVNEVSFFRNVYL